MAEASAELIEAERPYLLRYALAQLRERDAAEEAVQDTLLAALEGRDKFRGGSSLRTWLTGILRFKLIDLIRARSRTDCFDPLDTELSESDFDGLFTPSGHWQQAVAPWGEPEKTLIDRQFWEVFERCSKVMPRRTAMAFVMRELMGLEIAEICKQLDVTPTNCSVLLYRARMSLRECFTLQW